MATPALTIPIGVDLAAFEQGMKALNELTRQAAKSTLEQFLAVNAEIAKSSQTIMKTGEKQFSDLSTNTEFSSQSRQRAPATGLKAGKEKSEGDDKAKGDRDVKRPLLDFVKEADAVNKALENAAVNGLKKFEDGLVGMIMGTKTLKQAVGDMAKSIAEDLLKISIRTAITGPLSRALLGAFGGGGGGVDLAQAMSPTGLSLTGTGGLYANGGYTGAGGRNEPAGIVHRGEYVFDQDTVQRIGLSNLALLHQGYAEGGLVGLPAPPLKAPEVMKRGGDGPSVRISIPIDARGADEVGLARVQQQIAKLEATLPYKIKQVVADRPNARW